MIDRINIPQYIHDLLHEYSSVIVPGLGAFSTRYKHAEIDGNVNHIQPPIKTIEFNERLKINDGLLVGRIAQAEKVSGFEVTKIVDEFVKQSHEKLDRGQAISLPKIGELRKDGGGNISFSPFAGQNYATDTYGLGASDLPDDLLDEEAFDDTEFAPPFDMESAGHEASNAAYEQEVYEEKPRKKTVSSVLAQNMKNGEGEPVGEPVDGGRGGAFWMWLLPLLIAGLFLMLLYQLGSSDRSWKETKPFSYIFGSGDNTTTLADGDAAYTTDEIGTEGDGSEYGTEEDAATGEDSYNADAATDDYGTDSNNSDEYTDTNEGAEINEGEEPSDPYGGDGNTDTGYDGGTNNNDGDFDATGGRDDAYNDSDEYNNDNSDDYTAAATPPPPPPKRKPKPKPKPRPVDNSGSTVVEGMKITKSGLNEYVNTAAPQGYYVIVGAFKSRANAGKLAAKLRRDGLGSYILQTTSGYYRTGIYVPSGIATVREQYALARQRYNKGAWVLQYK